MASIQVVLRKKPNKVGQLPIAIRLTKDRKTSYIYIGQYIDIKHWDDTSKRIKKSHPNSARLNNLILKKLSETNDNLIQSETSNDEQSIVQIKKQVAGQNENIEFFKVSDIFLSNLLKRENHGEHYNQGLKIEIFKDHVGHAKLSFTDLNVNLLKDFEAHLLYERKVSARTAVNYLLLIRTIYNFAREEFGVDDKNYPFGKGKIQIKFPDTEKIGLNREEVQLLETAEGLTPAQQQAVHAWLISFYFAGMRIADVLRLKRAEFKDNRLYYRMGKNNKLVSLATPDKAQAILKHYIQEKYKNDLVFPYLEDTNLDDKKRLATRVKTITRSLNRRLEIVAKKLGIEKKLSTHIARHSFGNISGDKIPIQMLQKLYRHSSITTTVNYQSNFMHKETDDALDKVINF